MATKRSATDGGSSGGSDSPSGGPPPKKKLLTQFDPVKIGPVYSLEEMDLKVLQFQNRKLVERIEQRRKMEEDLRQRIEQLEQRQTTDDAVLVIVNRYWNQLDEDVRVLLQRFDAESADETLKKNESSAVTSFLTLLSQWDRPEIEETMRQRVEFSKRAIGKLLTAYDRLLQHNDKLWEAIKDKEDPLTKVENMDDSDNKADVKVKIEKTDGDAESAEVDSCTQTSTSDTQVKSEPEEKKPFVVSEAIKEELDRLMKENTRLQDIVTQLHQRHHEFSLQNAELNDRLGAAETEVAELKNQVEDVEYYLTASQQTVEKLDRHLADAHQKLKTYQEGEISVQGGGEGVSKNTFNEIAHELEEQKELSTNRLTELEKLNQDHQEAMKDIEKLKMDLATLPESVITETTEYKVLQSQFSVLYNESMTIKQQYEDARNLQLTTKTAHLRQIEQMESEELLCQKKLRTEVIQLEDQLAQVRREYEMLRIEFEQTLAANEQTGPINREMRNLISSLKNHNEQLKGEVQRYKRKLKEAQSEINKLHDPRNALSARVHVSSRQSAPPRSIPLQTLFSVGIQCELKLEQKTAQPADSGSDREEKTVQSTSAAGDGNKKEETADTMTPSNMPSPAGGSTSREEGEEVCDKKDEGRTRAESEVTRELRTELKKVQDRERDLKLLLDMYKSTAKESRDKAQLMMGERKMKQEIEDLKAHIRKLQEAERKERRKLAEDDALRKIKKMEETITELQKSLSLQKQEEETLLNEMEVTGQAFEDMQEQNIRLMQQLREKDDANFKLMSERIKSNQILKLMREEKEVLGEQVTTLQMQVEAQNQVVRKLEEKERIIQNNLATVEKECGLRQQTLEAHKRKAVESSQTAADLKLHLDKYHAQLKEAQAVVADKTSALQQQSFKYKRMQEEIASARRKLERAKKIEMASSADEVLMEEIREYKEQLTCPSCKVKKKDAVLTKCFHVFCLVCLKTRYETRQRKCPKCNAAFGANDYHRIYLE